MRIVGKIDEKVDVAVFMLAYNHEKWIQKAIESIINQRINFRMKVYIHDDCSTDNTKEIIEHEYQLHPNVIVPIYEEINQYSKGNSILSMVVPLLNCDFIALCEGDDFWINKNKLQLQFDYMKNHKECSYCFGNAMLVDINDNPIRKFYSKYLWKDRKVLKKLKSKSNVIFTTEEIIFLDFVPTASVMFRYDVWNTLKEYTDRFDLSIRLAAMEVGEIYYINNLLSAYRIGNSASASGRAVSSYESFKEDYYERHKAVYEEFNKRTNDKYAKFIERELQRKLLQVYECFSLFNEMKQQVSYNDLKILVKLQYCIKCNLPVVYNYIRKLRNLITQTLYKY